MEESNAIELQQKQNGSILLAEAKSIKIVDQASNELASSFSIKTRSAIKTIDEWMNPQIESANKTHKLLTGKRAELRRPFQEAQAIVDTELGRYYMEQKRIKDAQEELLHKEAEKQRLQAQEALIAAALDQNDESLLAAAENVFVPDIKLAEPTRSTVTDSGSTNVRIDIKVEVADKREIILLVSSNSYLDNFIDINLSEVKKYCKAHNLKVLHGFKITETWVVSGRSK